MSEVKCEHCKHLRFAPHGAWCSLTDESLPPTETCEDFRKTENDLESPKDANQSKISLCEWWRLSDLMIDLCRDLDDDLKTKGGWKGWTTSGTRTMTDEILQTILDELNIAVDYK